jgi:NAD(P)-dependent dehydrogenase (short-subunit alcohol dehydrogenase family)
MDHASRTAIVTGAGKRVGAELARALLDDGWTVLAHVRREGEWVPEGAIAVAAGLEESDCAEKILSAAAGRAPVRLLVNNAARFAFDSADAFDPNEFDLHMAVNLRAPLLLAQSFAGKHQGGDALIVNVLDSKLSAPNSDFFSYTLAKQGLAAATGLLARSFAAKGIRVNAISPALMLRSPGQSAENFETMHSANPLGRGVEPADVIAALRYLIAADKVTGQCITIDSGHRFLQLARDVQFLGDQ